jgi:hypothetical protein
VTGRVAKAAWLGCFVLVRMVLSPSASHAQASAESLLKGAPGSDHFRGRVAMDPGFQFGLGYVRAFDLGAKRQLGAHADVAALLDFSSWEVTSGVSARLLDRPGFDVLGTVDLDLGIAQNEVHTALDAGYRVALLPGHYCPKWYVATEFGFRGAFFATMWQRGAYQEQFPAATDGTYVTGAAYFTLGAAAGLRFFRHYFAGARFAYRIPTTFENYGPWVQPMTMGLEVGGTVDWF